MDLDISHYSTDELIDLLEISEVSRTTITEAVQHEIEKHHRDKPLVEFLKTVELHLLATLSPEPDSVFQTDVKRGIINPDLKNTLTRIINIDSACRVNLIPDNYTSDNFSFELTEPLLNVISIALYSVEIPQSWYSNTFKKGTTSFILCSTVNGTTTRHTITIPDGNYTTLSLPVAVVAAITLKTGLTPITTYNAYTGKLSIDFQTTDLIQLIWYDGASANPDMALTHYNSNLGWMLGFRSPITTCVNGITHAQSLVDASGTKYIIISLNDYKTNRLNRNIVSVNTVPKIPVSMPSYYNESTPQYKSTTTRVHVIPADPRNLTSKQLFTINSISDQTTLNQRCNAYDASDIFAKIPFKKTDWGKYDGTTMVVSDAGPAKLFVEAGGPLQLQMREYFGPVNLTTMMVALYDDKGQILGLNGMDWSFTLVVKCIYQY